MEQAPYSSGPSVFNTLLAHIEPKTWWSFCSGPSHFDTPLHIQAKKPVLACGPRFHWPTSQIYLCMQVARPHMVVIDAETCHKIFVLHWSRNRSQHLKPNPTRSNQKMTTTATPSASIASIVRQSAWNPESISSEDIFKLF